MIFLLNLEKGLLNQVIYWAFSQGSSYNLYVYSILHDSHYLSSILTVSDDCV